MSSQRSLTPDPRGRDDPAPGGGRLLARLLADPRRRGRITHVQHVPARRGRRAEWPAWVPRLLIDRLALAGIDAPWEHQVTAAEHARAGRSVIIATGTASGKSLAYLMPALSAVLGEEPTSAQGTVLYLSPTKALAADQLRSLRGLRLTRLRAATYDGDTPADERGWVRQYADYVLTNPDMLHRSILPGHARWSAFLRRLRYVIIDEAHGYRGVFGSHVAQVLRRLRRICARYGVSPVFILASATTAEPAETARRLTGVPVEAVADDASPRAAASFALWEPPLTDLRGERGAPVRRSATAEAADLLADLVVEDVQTLAFVRSRRGAESVALSARRALDEVAPELSGRVAAYRAGYLPEERRALESALRAREIVGLASTNALELGVDVSGLDAVLVCGWPGTRASLWQQAGRAGRAGQEALAVLVARDDPLDTFLVHHPEAIFGTPVEATVLDPDNPYVLEPHLCAAAAESPLTEADIELFGPVTAHVLPDLVRRGLLRHRATGWYWTRRERATDLADIRGAGGTPIQVVEASTGRLLGTVDEASAHTTVHEGAVYLHQGESFLVQTLDLDDSVALVDPAEPDYTTTARDVTDIRIIETLRTSSWGRATLCFGTVEVTRQVVAYQMRRLQSGEMLGEKPLDLPPRTLRTRAVWWTLANEQLNELGTPGAGPGLPAGDARGPRVSAPGLAPSSEPPSRAGRGVGPAPDLRAASDPTPEPVPAPDAALEPEPGLIPTLDPETSPGLTSTSASDLHSQTGEAVQPDTGLVTGSGPSPEQESRPVLAPDSASPPGTGLAPTLEPETSPTFRPDRDSTPRLGFSSRAASDSGREPRAGFVPTPRTEPGVGAGLDLDLPGAAHAAEHASIGLLPLFATCDRWDIGGVSTACHPDTGLLTVFVYDGHEGGAGFAERGYSDAAAWLHATRDAILACECEAGCPSCIQSPKCGNGNDPLDKGGAVVLLDALLRDVPKVTKT
ncbi:DEAD/DEAH box helicase domain-containing protein [Thermomonospora umbrina]|uniref:DEAD/DEAH box helicase domain-containing protein n=1 Tax=Thermomonospora umbrina TaxID=111806 RepID=A0A3D9SMD1_9ACTN|nr:DEAD/DEAH box helicase domain-containing protein [Thermomonospora umbrina]